MPRPEVTEAVASLLNLQDESEEAKRVQSGSQAEPTKSWGKSWEALTAIQDAWRWRLKEEPQRAEQGLVHSGVQPPEQSPRAEATPSCPGPGSKDTRLHTGCSGGTPSTKASLPRQPGCSSTFLAPVRTLAGRREERVKQPGVEVRGARTARAPGEERGDSACLAAANLGPRLLLGSPGAPLPLLSACS